jgi:methyl coenzyme M reductase beta subunit
MVKTENQDVTDVTAKPVVAAPESLDALAREADMLDASADREAVAGQVAETAQMTASNESELLVTLQAIRAMAFPMLAMVTDEQRMAALAQVWNDGVLGASAAAGAAVLEKHGLSMGSVMGEYGCYVMLVAALAPPIVMTKKILETPKERAKQPGAVSPTQNAGDGQQQ